MSLLSCQNLDQGAAPLTKQVDTRDARDAVREQSLKFLRASDVVPATVSASSSRQHVMTKSYVLPPVSTCRSISL